MPIVAESQLTQLSIQITRLHCSMQCKAYFPKKPRGAKYFNLKLVSDLSSETIFLFDIKMLENLFLE